MVHRVMFDRIKQQRGGYASWAVWADATDTPKSNMGDLRVLDPDLNPTLMHTLRNDVIMVGLNISKAGYVVEPFRNFHGAIGGAYKIRYAFTGTPYYGAYMTDFIQGLEMADSNGLMRYLRANPAVVRENAKRFIAELNELQCDRPIILTFGERASQLVANPKNVPLSNYSRHIPLRHYSDYISQEDYRQDVLRRIGSAS